MLLLVSLQVGTMYYTGLVYAGWLLRFEFRRLEIYLSFSRWSGSNLPEGVLMGRMRLTSKG